MSCMSYDILVNQDDFYFFHSYIFQIYFSNKVFNATYLSKVITEKKVIFKNTVGKSH